MPSLGLKAQVGAKAICFTETLDLQQKERRAGSLRLVLWLPCDLGEVISHFWTGFPDWWFPDWVLEELLCVLEASQRSLWEKACGHMRL